MPGERFITFLTTSLKPGVAILPLAVMFAQMQAAAQDATSATQSITVTGKAELAAQKKAERARKIAERDAREAADYSPLGSHIRDEAAGSAIRNMSKDELARREAGKVAGEAFGESVRVPMGPSNDEITRSLAR